MPADLRKISWLAVFLLVVLRVSIGWHLFYEGLWKIKTQKTANPWTAEGYLRIATGPLRTTFREMTGDPNDYRWLDYKQMSDKWDAWRARFEKHYQLDDAQKNRLSLLLDGPEEGFSVNLDNLPSGFSFDDAIKSAGIAKGAIRYDADKKKLTVDGKLHLLPAEQARLLDAVKKSQEATTDPGANEAYTKVIQAIESVGRLASRLSYRERLAAMLNGDPDRNGIIQQTKSDGGEELVVTVGEVKFYKELVDRYEAKHAKARTKTEWDHLDHQWSDLQAKRRSLVGPVQALDKDLRDDANKILTVEQFALGSVPEEVTKISRINSQTMWGLTILGTMLMLGLFTRLSALGGACMLTMFYLALPPWPGLQEPPGIEHNFIINKVLVEAIALLAIAAIPSGRWFGLDAIVSMFNPFCKRRCSANKSSP